MRTNERSFERKKDKKRKNGRAPQTFPLYDLSNEGSC